MDERRFWFEEVPEKERYWFLTQWGMSPRQESEGPSEAEDAESHAQSASSFGDKTGEEAGEAWAEDAETFRRLQASGYGEAALEAPWWADLISWDHEDGPERVRAPVLYTQRERAEEELRRLEERDAASYLRLVEQHGEAHVNEVYDNSPPYEVRWVGRRGLLESLEEASFLCVMVDGVLKLRRDFIEELRRDGEEEHG